MSCDDGVILYSTKGNVAVIFGSIHKPRVRFPDQYSRITCLMLVIEIHLLHIYLTFSTIVYT